MAAIIHVQDRVKHYEAPVRDGGLPASTRSVASRRRRAVRAFVRLALTWTHGAESRGWRDGRPG